VTAVASSSLSALLDLVLPAHCAGCGTPGTLWCACCASYLARPEAVARPLLAHGPPVYALGAHRGPARAAVLAYKERGRRGLARPLGRSLAGVLPRLPGARAGPDGTWWLVPVPSRRAAARARGGDHVLRLARRCAAELAAAGRPAAVAPVLRLEPGVSDSVGLGRVARVANLAGRVRLRAGRLPPAGTPVVLLDDVVTTGTTLAVCSGVLATAGLVVCAAVVLTATGRR